MVSSSSGGKYCGFTVQQYEQYLVIFEDNSTDDVATVPSKLSHIAISRKMWREGRRGN